MLKGRSFGDQVIDSIRTVSKDKFGREAKSTTHYSNAQKASVKRAKIDLSLVLLTKVNKKRYNYNDSRNKK